MIHKVVPSVIASLNEYIRNEYNLQENMVVLTNPVDMNGKLNPQIDNKLCVFVQHFEEEKLLKNAAYQANAGMNPPTHFNVYLMFIANFPDPNYLESLRFISIVLEFFQGIRVFDRSNTPMLSANVEKIAFEYVNLDTEAMRNIWGMIGLKYMPSLIYKLKLLSFTNDLIREDFPSIIKNPKKSEIDKKLLEEAAIAAATMSAISSQNEDNKNSR